MSVERIDFINGQLQVTDRSESTVLDPAQIDMIAVCRMEDEAYQGDEEFHILCCGQRFWLIGPFIAGALDAIDRLCAAYPTIPVRYARVASLSRRLRAPGLLGLRLFPIAGLGEFAIIDLPKLSFIEENDHVRNVDRR